MNTRLILFALALLFLPPFALTLAEQEWLAPTMIEGAVWLPALFTLFVLFACIWLMDRLSFRKTQHSMLRAQRHYLLWCGVAGLFIGMLLGWLNLFSASWFSPASPAGTLLLAALAGAALLPAVIVARRWLAGLPGLVRLGMRRFALPALPAEPAARSLLFAALLGLMLGPIHIRELGWLFWLSPLLLLAALQLLWHESTVFSGLAQGDWSRVLLGSLSGILVCGIALICYRMTGGTLQLTSGTSSMFFGFALFGILALQLGDIVAEHWRGKTRGEVFKKKPFPIPIVTKKDQ